MNAEDGGSNVGTSIGRNPVPVVDGGGLFRAVDDWSAERFMSGFPNKVLRDGTICARFLCDSGVSGHSDGGTQWVTGEKKHFGFGSMANSGV